MSFIRKFKTASGIYLARVENKRIDGKVKQTVIERLGKAPDTEETLFKRVNRLTDQLRKAQTRLNKASGQLANLQESRREAERKALGELATDDVEDWRIELRLRLLKVLSDGQWHSSFTMSGAVGRFIRPEIMARADPRGKYNLDRGVPIVVTKELQDMRLGKRIEKRPGNDRSSEWRLADCAWAEQILAKTPRIMV